MKILILMSGLMLAMNVHAFDEGDPNAVVKGDGTFVVNPTADKPLDTSVKSKKRSRKKEALKEDANVNPDPRSQPISLPYQTKTSK